MKLRSLSVKSRFSAMVCIIIGLLITILVNFTIVYYSYKEYEDDFQRKAELVFASVHDMLLQHKIMIGALASLFNTSLSVNKQDFTVFSHKLLKLNSAVAFTLDDDFQIKYLSDDNFTLSTLAGKMEIDPYGQPEYVMQGFTSITVKIDVPNMPFLVYAIPHAMVQNRLDIHLEICARLTLMDTQFNNEYCQDDANTGIASLFKFQGSYARESPVYNKKFRILAWSIAPPRSIYQLLLLVLFTTVMGGSLTLLMCHKIRSHLRLTLMTIETQAKLALLSTINHEIRTPINAVLGYSQMLKDNDSGSMSTQDTLDKIIWSANLLNSVAENTLNFAKAEAGKLTLDYRDVNLAREINNIHDYYRAFGQIQDKHLIVNMAENVAGNISLDSTKFFQLTTNFINNAFKYSGGNEILLDVSLKSVAGQDFVRVAVKDSGKGMSRQALRAIKHPFTTDPTGHANSQSGIGIGLYTCNKVLEQIGGSLCIRSQNNRGTLVLFRFPYRRASSELTSYQCAAPEIRYPSQQESAATQPVKVPVRDRTQASSSGLSLLLVDDNRFNLEVCGSILESGGFKVNTFQDEDQVLDAFKASEPDIVVMDYRLAKIDGISLIGQMQQHQTRKVHYFILSANDRSEMPNADAYPDISFLRKPLYLEVFMELLDLKLKLV